MLYKGYETGHLGQAVPFHEVRYGPAVARWVVEGVSDLQRQGDKIGANTEIHRLAQAQNAGEAPDEIDTQSENGKTQEHAEQRHHVLVPVQGVSADQHHHDRPGHDRPDGENWRFAGSPA